MVFNRDDVEIATEETTPRRKRRHRDGGDDAETMSVDGRDNSETEERIQAKHNLARRWRRRSHEAATAKKEKMKALGSNRIKRGSLWVAWARQNLLQKKGFWETKLTTSLSWNMRKLLKLRPMAKPFLQMELGDGSKALFWQDNWMSMGVLIDVVGRKDISLLGARSDILLQLHIALLQTPVPSDAKGPDRALWRHKHDVFMPYFSSAKTREQIREHLPEKEWHKLVWFRGAIPRMSFHLWQQTDLEPFGYLLLAATTARHQDLPKLD
ncbi:PREDICTED: uncharacterized protein LOC104801847 [Tarenaya hassleriana]|uniref:uncharacterized protein LOC104801847 n=1 Tax=Tarenaya hassleriana TaxID=28532 RepID=UPI00053C6569|nr:PREDICTED: uncharacterized protein LOC104801847 [Tarenaya hassleriana]